MNKIEHVIKIESDVPTVYKAMTTEKGLESWHSAHIEGNIGLNSQFTINHEKNPSFTWKIVSLKPDQHIEWECIKGPGDAPGTHVWFNLAKLEDGRVVVECTHQGWPDTNGNFKKCNTLWGMLLCHLKHFVETGESYPAFN